VIGKSTRNLAGLKISWVVEVVEVIEVIEVIGSLSRNLNVEDIINSKLDALQLHFYTFQTPKADQLTYSNLNSKYPPNESPKQLMQRSQE